MSIRTFDGAVALITGGATGIGSALGQELARRGAEAVVLADIRAEVVEETAEQINKSANRKCARALTLDVRDQAATNEVIEKTFAESKSKRLDYVFANAGTGVFGEVHLIDHSDWDLVVDVNIHGVINTVRAAYPKLIAQGFGHLVNIASLAGLIPVPFLVPYSMTKHAVVGLSKSLRVEAARHGVRVTAICPGAIRTPLLTGGAQGRTVYSGLTSERIFQWWNKLGPVTELAPFAKDAIDAVAKNERVVVLPKRNRALLAVLALLPRRMEEKLATKMYSDTLRDFPEIAKGK